MVMARPSSLLASLSAWGLLLIEEEDLETSQGETGDTKMRYGPGAQRM